MLLLSMLPANVNVLNKAPFTEKIQEYCSKARTKSLVEVESSPIGILRIQLKHTKI